MAVLFYRLEHTTRAAPEMDPEDFEALEMRLHSALDEAFGDLARGSTHFAQGGRFVFFGYPVAYGQDARRAVEAALRLVALARGLNEALAREGAGGLEVRVGIHSGVVLSGSGVSEIRGAALGIATDLEHCAAHGQILVSPAAWQMLEGHFRGETLQDGNFAVLGAMEDTESGIAAGVMVGRDLKLNMLLSRLEEARAGETQMALISGEAGIGKSRLLQALRDSPEAAGVAWAECGCSPYFQASAFIPSSSWSIRSLSKLAPYVMDRGQARRSTSAYWFLVALRSALRGWISGWTTPAPWPAMASGCGWSIATWRARRARSSGATVNPNGKLTALPATQDEVVNSL